ncbi:MAG TPA: hypothetical protein DCY40_02240 [Actinobacteria bacterium]|nr:hypothetical protein [Actinomycetota bacterium]
MAVQRVRRVIRKIDPWTVLKVSMVFNLIMSLAFVLGTVIFWAIFVNAGIPEKINELALLIGLENGINLEGAIYFRIVVLLAVVGTIGMTGFITLGSVVYNLISDLVGGIEVVVLEETTGPIVTRPVMSFAARKTEPPRRSILPGLKPKKPAEPTPEVERTAT